MPVTVEKSPTADSGQWLNGSKAYVRDYDCAVCSISGREHKYYNYGFTIPTGSIINQVLIKPYHAEDGSTDDFIVYVSWDGGETWSAGAVCHIDGDCSSSDVDILDASDLTDWNTEKLSDDNFRIKVQFRVGTGCFAYGSKIRMFNGSIKKIEDIKLGDEVLSWRPRKGQVKGIIIAINQHEFLKPPEMLRIITNKGTLTLTPNHKVCVTLEHTFKEASLLKIGDTLITEKDETAKILKIQKIKTHKMINLQIDALTFYVNNFLVHNIVKEPY